jgi:hypothetical protein
MTDETTPVPSPAAQMAIGLFMQSFLMLSMDPDNPALGAAADEALDALDSAFLAEAMTG